MFGLAFRLTNYIDICRSQTVREWTAFGRGPETYLILGNVYLRLSHVSQIRQVASQMTIPSYEMPKYIYMKKTTQQAIVLHLDASVVDATDSARCERRLNRTQCLRK